jgi:transcriptional regulator with XRE-family HTH domain
MTDSVNALRLTMMFTVHGLTRTEVARAAGVDPSLVTRWLNGERRVSPEAAAAIVKLIASKPLLLEAR